MIDPNWPHRVYLDFPGASLDGIVEWVGEETIDASCRKLRIDEKFNGSLSRLAQFKKLEYLRIPTSLIRELTGSALPDSLRVIATSGPSKKTCTFLDQGVFPIDRIITGKLRIDTRDFPNLRHVDVDLDAKLLDNLGGMRDPLITVNVQNLRKDNLIHDALTQDAFRQIEFLGLRGGEISNAIGNLPNLRSLWIQSLRDFDMKYIEELPVEELTIGYMKEIRSLERVCAFPHLRHLRLFGCGDVGISKIRDALCTRGVKVVLSGAR
ncbi:MAG: hypothetical protein R3F19_19530 [Verrucomicrobiales bacterium]